MKKIKSFRGRFQEVTVQYFYNSDLKSIKYKHFSPKDPGTPIEEEIEAETKSEHQLIIESLNELFCTK